MTTIATDGKCVAYDKRMTSAQGFLMGEESRKALPVSEHVIAAASGSQQDGDAFLEWVTRDVAGERPEKPKPDDDFCGIIVDTKQGTCLYYRDKLRPAQVTVPFAIGSGDDLAIGAMLAGKHPAEAVRIAAMRDLNTGADVVWLPAGEPAAGDADLVKRLASFHFACAWLNMGDDSLYLEETEIGVAPHVQIMIPKHTFRHTQVLRAEIGTLMERRSNGRPEQDHDG